jgi:hypothetical protein
MAIEYNDSLRPAVLVEANRKASSLLSIFSFVHCDEAHQEILISACEQLLASRGYQQPDFELAFPVSSTVTPSM